MTYASDEHRRTAELLFRGQNTPKTVLGYHGIDFFESLIDSMHPQVVRMWHLAATQVSVVVSKVSAQSFPRTEPERRVAEVLVRDACKASDALHACIAVRDAYRKKNK